MAKQPTLDELIADDASLATIYERADRMRRRERIVSLTLVGLLLIATHATAATLGAYVWHLIRGC
jgi:hypothetical protein